MEHRGDTLHSYFYFWTYLVKDEHTEVLHHAAKAAAVARQMVEHPSGCPDEHVRRAGRDALGLGVHVGATDHDLDAHAHVRCELLSLHVDLHGELASGAEDEHTNLARTGGLTEELWGGRGGK